MDITGPAATDRFVIDGYGEGGFRINAQRYEGSVLLLPSGPQAWAASSAEHLAIADFATLAAAADDIELLLLGTGQHFALIPPALRSALKDQGLVVENMDTGAACRTYNVLLYEGRQVAAALIAVG